MQVIRLNTIFKNPYGKKIISLLGIQPRALFDGRVLKLDVGENNSISEFKVLGDSSDMVQITESCFLDIIKDKNYLDLDKKGFKVKTPTALEPLNQILMTLVVRVVDDLNFEVPSSDANRIIGVGSAYVDRAYMLLKEDGFYAASGNPGKEVKVSDRSTKYKVITVLYNGDNSLFIDGPSDVNNIALNPIENVRYNLSLNYKGSGSADYSIEVPYYSMWVGEFGLDQIKDHHANILSQYSNLIV